MTKEITTPSTIPDSTIGLDLSDKTAFDRRKR